MTTAIYNIQGRRSSPCVDGRIWFWIINDAHVISRFECGLHFLTFVLKLRKTPEKSQPRNWPTGSYVRATLKPIDISVVPISHVRETGHKCREKNYTGWTKNSVPKKYDRYRKLIQTFFINKCVCYLTPLRRYTCFVVASIV